MSISGLARSDEQWRRRFGARLRELRQERGLSQEVLSERAGVDRKLVYRTELAQTSPRLDAVRAIARALDIRLADLFGGLD